MQKESSGKLNDKKHVAIVLSQSRASILSLVLFVIISIIYLAIAFFTFDLHPGKVFTTASELFSILEGFFLLSILFLGVLVHEFIHAVFYALFSQQGFKSVRFHFDWKKLTPVSFSLETIKVWQYALAVLMPFILLGLLPIIYAAAKFDLRIFMFGFLFILPTASDLLVLWMLRRFNKNQKVLDHPTELGFYILND